MDPMLDIPTPNDPTPFLPDAQDEADKALLVKFFIKAREDRDASAREGRPVFKDVEYIDIKVPGSKAGACRPATDRDKARFPNHYRAFKERQAHPEVGTPLEEWPPISRSMVEQLKFFNVKTVEQLAAVPDSSIPNVMGLQRFKQLAISYLDASKADAPLAALRAEIEEKDAKIAAQGATIDALSARLDALEAAARGAEPTPQGEAPAPEPTPQAPVEEPSVTGYKSVLDAGASEEPEVEPEPEPEAPAPEPEVAAETPPRPQPGRRRRRN